MTSMHKYALGALLLILLVGIIFLITSFSGNTLPIDTSDPATAFCLEQGGEVEMVNDPSGVYGLCILPGGDIVCNKDAFFTGDCPINADYEYARHECAPEEKTVDVCHEVYQLVCGYSSKGSAEFSNGCFACKKEEVLFWITGACEE